MILENISLKPYNTFGLDYKAFKLIVIKSEEEAVALIKSRYNEHNFFVLGGGSNLLLTKDQTVVFLHPLIYDIKVEEFKNDNVIVSAGCGVKWDDLVGWSVSNGYSGIENLSHIPGSVGASPVQNIGAYGSEAKDTITKVRTIDLLKGTFTEFSADECSFRYRYSIFKGELKGRYLVTRVYFRLSLHQVPNTGYGSLNEEALRLGGLTLKNIRQAVINIRESKLPDPAVTGNAGSFFKNPLVDTMFAEKLKSEFPALPVYSDPTGRKKLAAGWLIEQCGWKGKRFGDTGVHEKQALVIVNYGNATGKEVWELSEKIRLSVLERFSVSLEREVEVL